MNTVPSNSMKPNLIILKRELSVYNVPVYNEITKFFNLTVAYHTADKSRDNCSFKKIKLEPHHFGPFVWIKNLRKLTSQFDIVCFSSDLHELSFCLLPFLPRKNKVVNWSIGFSVSYTHPYKPYRKHTFKDRVLQMVLNKCDASIFYMDKAKEFWKGTSLDLGRVFVAPNTAQIEDVAFIPDIKTNFLFVGTLYKGKGVDVLLNAFEQALKDTGKDARLVVIGDGEMRPVIEQHIKVHNLQDSVKLLGSIYDETRLAEEFQKALLCISPNQGGLSCPKSMGYGVPFVCQRDAITGGEIYHITNGINGIIYDTYDDLVNILKDAIQSPQRYIDMGLEAKHYYENNATISHMANGAIQAFNYALSH